MLVLYDNNGIFSKPLIAKRKIYDEESINKLRVCFVMTDWDMFITGCDNYLDELDAVVTSYKCFCEKLNLSTKTINISKIKSSCSEHDNLRQTLENNCEDTCRYKS